MTLVKDTVNPDHPNYNAKAARAKLMSADTSMQWGPGVDPAKLAHGDDKMACFTCHLSWTTSCAGCHLPIQANWKTERQHYEGGETRNYATYNPQVARDEMFQLGKHGPVKGGKIAPVRSSSALILSSTNINREKIYIQQPPIAASGFSSQAFAPHYPHTERKTETKTCTDCHLSQKNDNNAIMAQLLLHGTNFVNFVGYNAWVGEEGRVTARAGHRVGRAAGRHRQLPAQVRVSGLVRRPPEARPAAAGGGAARARAARRPACRCAANTCTSPKGPAASASTTSPASPTRAFRRRS